MIIHIVSIWTNLSLHSPGGAGAARHGPHEGGDRRQVGLHQGIQEEQLKEETLVCVHCFKDMKGI